MTQISVLGCGWLGLPLAKILIDKGFFVKGSTTSSNKISILKNFNIEAFQIKIYEDEILGNIQGFFDNSKILIINIPPKLRHLQKENFVEKIKNLIPLIEMSTIENLLFISSTSIYGENNCIVTEESLPNPETESGKQLLKAEQILLKNKNFKTTILRLGGLIGEDRHPVKFLSGKKNIENPNAPINLIHQDDCIRLILEIIIQGQNKDLVWNETFNAVAPFHPNRKDYYEQKAIELGIDLPEFSSINNNIGKIISSSKLVNVLEYVFSKPYL